MSFCLPTGSLNSGDVKRRQQQTVRNFEISTSEDDRLFFSFFFVFHPVYCLRPSILSLLVVTQIRGHIAGSSPPLPTTVRALPTTVRALDFFLFLRDFSSSLVDSRRVVLTHARRSQQFVPLWSYHWAFDGWRFCCDGSSTFSVCVSSELALER